MKLYEVEFRAVITLAAQDMQKATLHGTGVIKESPHLFYVKAVHERNFKPAGEILESSQSPDVSGIVFFDSQVRFMIKESIEHVGCVAHRRVNDFGVEGRVAVRDMRVEGNPRTTAVTSVDLAGVFTAPTDVKILSVRRGGCPRAPMAGKG